MILSTANRTSYLVRLSLMAAVVVVVAFVPFLGYIPLVVIKATTVHIPVIIGALLMGPKAGGILGGVFGITSVIKNTMEPNLTSFVFSPFIAVPGSTSGDWRALLIAIVPRVLIGVIAGWLFPLLRRTTKREKISAVIASVAGSFANTILVMGSIYFLFGQQYAAAQGKPFEALAGALIAVVCTNGVAEALVAGVLCPLIALPLWKVFSKKRG